MTNLFCDFDLSIEMQKAIQDMHYEQMTEIQAGAIPAILAGRDMIGHSSTGTGKTAAFGIPIIEKVQQKESRKPQVLILCPTRELAMQISGELRKYAKYKQGIKIATVYGGEAMINQIRQLKGAAIVVGTPGRVMDHMRRGTLKLDEVQTVVLDEADEMLNMGFLEDMQTILQEVPEERQTLLFSATMPASILKITKQFQKNPQLIAISKGQRSMDAISQFYYTVSAEQKREALNLLLQKMNPKRSIVFCNTKKMVDELVFYLNECGFHSIGLHGDMRQAARTQVMQDYKNGRIQILVATDVAARGIDVEDIDAVFNYDIPQEDEYYIHRIGRTARAGKKGSSYTLVCNRYQLRRIHEIEEHAHTKIAFAAMPSGTEIENSRKEYILRDVKEALSSIVDPFYLEMSRSLLQEEYAIEDLVAVLLSKGAEKNQKAIPLVEPISLGGEKRSRGGNRVVLELNIGRSKRLAPNHIIQAITAVTGLPAKAVGNIDIFPDYTLIEMSGPDSKLVLQKMARCKIKNIPAAFRISKTQAGQYARVSPKAKKKEK